MTHNDQDGADQKDQSQVAPIIERAYDGTHPKDQEGLDGANP